jgi:glyceraldehyde-3-phosphate dehydrogenase/erythrose-4-phosphate dehydrogenase
MKTEAAQAATEIRKELKLKFPGFKFSVRSSNFSMGNSVDIDWTDGPTTEQVDAIVDKYQYGHFDGSIDMYEYSNKREDIPQAKFVQTQRSMSAEIVQQIRNENVIAGDNEWDKMQDCWGSAAVYRIFAKKSYYKID